MAALVWLLIPVAGTLIATLWAARASRRSTGAGGIHDSAGVRRHQAFRAAMERPAREAAGPARPEPEPGREPRPGPAAAPATEPAEADRPAPAAPVVMGSRAPAPADG
jgi:hypothetical protein